MQRSPDSCYNRNQHTSESVRREMALSTMSLNVGFTSTMWWFTIIHASQECACRLRVLSGNSASMLDSFVFRRCLCHGYNTCCSQEMGRHAEILMLATNLSVHGAMHVAHVMKRVRKPAGLHDCGKVALSNAWKCNLHHNGSTPIFN